MKHRYLTIWLSNGVNIVVHMFTRVCFGIDCPGQSQTGSLTGAVHLLYLNTDVPRATP